MCCVPMGSIRELGAWLVERRWRTRAHDVKAVTLCYRPIERPSNWFDNSPAGNTADHLLHSAS
jgi:hypothetical protein